MSLQGHDWQNPPKQICHGCGLLALSSLPPWVVCVALHSLLAGHNRTPEMEQLLKRAVYQFSPFQPGAGCYNIYLKYRNGILDSFVQSSERNMVVRVCACFCVGRFKSRNKHNIVLCLVFTFSIVLFCFHICRSTVDGMPMFMTNTLNVVMPVSLALHLANSESIGL